MKSSSGSTKARVNLANIRVLVVWWPTLRKLLRYYVRRGVIHKVTEGWASEWATPISGRIRPKTHFVSICEQI